VSDAKIFLSSEVFLCFWVKCVNTGLLFEIKLSFLQRQMSTVVMQLILTSFRLEYM